MIYGKKFNNNQSINNLTYDIIQILFYHLLKKVPMTPNRTFKIFLNDYTLKKFQKVIQIKKKKKKKKMKKKTNKILLMRV